MAMSFGDRLREAREQRKVTLHAIAEKTNISVRFLDALEKGHIDKLPGGIFTRGFVRSYAAHIGLDPDQAVKDFLAAYPRARGDEDGDDDVVRQGPAPWVIGVVAILLLALIGVAIYMWAGRRAAPATSAGERATPAAAQSVAPAVGESPTLEPTPPVPTAAPLAAPEPAASAAVAGQDRSAAATPSADVTTPTAVAPLMLAVMPTGRCWVRVTADGRVRLSREVTAGERVDIDATERLDLVVGDAGAFAYRINGRPGRPLGLAGQVARATIAPGSVASFQSSVIGH